MSAKFLNGIDANSKNITNVASPSGATDAVNKSYVDGLVNGLDWKASVRAATTAAGTLASSFANGSVIDGVTLATNDRVLLKNQAAGAENGIYTVNASGAPTRATDADAAGEVTANMSVFVEEGTVNADTAWTLTNNGTITLGTTALTFAQVGSGTSYTADGNGIELVGSQFQLELDGTTLSKSASGVRIGSGAAGAGLVEATGVLAVGAGTGITVAADTVGIDTSVVVRKFAANCVVTTNPQTFTHNLGTLDVHVQVVEVSSGNFVLADVTAATTNTVSVNFGGAPTASQYRIVVMG